MRMARGFPVIAVTGPRQSGKTTIASEFFDSLKKWGELSGMSVDQAPPEA
jgi:predicted AAA+ superfamily ATPase